MAANLSTKKVGFQGSVLDLKGEPVVVSRLIELGFIRGEQVRIEGKAPFGDPILVEVRGAVIALRAGEAACIQLKEVTI